ncbi:MAG: type II toxin-antitoxin system HicB family antitoxin [Candidatus Competibacteraceae bacterium]
MNRQLTVIIEKEDDGYVALCPEVDVASQGDSILEAKDNLREAQNSFFETASAQEISAITQRSHITQLEVAVG